MKRWPLPPLSPHPAQIFRKKSWAGKYWLIFGVRRMWHPLYLSREGEVLFCLRRKNLLGYGDIVHWIFFSVKTHIDWCGNTYWKSRYKSRSKTKPPSSSRFPLPSPGQLLSVSISFCLLWMDGLSLIIYRWHKPGVVLSGWGQGGKWNRMGKRSCRWCSCPGVGWWVPRCATWIKASFDLLDASYPVCYHESI